MDILKAFSLTDGEIHINIKGTYENPLFKANDIGKILGIKKIKDNIADFNDDEKEAITIGSLGGPQKTIFLTELGLYKIIGRSRKPIAQTFQKWIINIVKEIRITGMYKLNLENEVDRKLHEQKLILSSHKSLMKAYHNKNIVYICKIKDDPDNPNLFIIKIGSTQNVKECFSHIATTYDTSELILLDAFQCEMHTKFEKMIHNNVNIQKYQYNKIIKLDGHISREIYLVNTLIYADIIQNIEKMKTKYNPDQDPNVLIRLEELRINTEQLHIEAEKVKLETENAKIKKLELELELIKNSNHVEKENDIEFDDKLELYDRDSQDNDHVQLNYIKKRVNGIRIPKVYQYSPDNLTQPIKIFDAPSDVERAFNNVSVACLKRASKQNTLYKDFRWLYVSRTEEPPNSINPTNITRNIYYQVQFIAMIDIKKTKILAVYASHKDAIEARNMKCNSFTRAIKQQSVSSGHYWNYWNACSEDMCIEFLKTNKLPEKHANPTGIKIQQLDPKTMSVIAQYNSKRDIIKKFQISNIKLDKLINTEQPEIYNGFIWKKVIE
jgi:prophage antirepressor-like protein